MNAIQKKSFKEISLQDKFFDTLKLDYPGFEGWFNKKALNNEYAFVLDDNGVQGFLYLKEEDEECKNITPSLCKSRRLKVGTFKINAHGTRLGERFVKIIIDEMFKNNFNEAYVTVFEEHKSLIELLEKYGFIYHGKKNSVAGMENVYIKNLNKMHKDMFLDYPKITIKNNNKLLLSIWPEFHTRLFPDSKLKTEKDHKIEDIPSTNSIEKTYLSGANLSMYKEGDIVVIYRTADSGKSAAFSSVATSICTIKEIKHIDDFTNYEEFERYCIKNSVFTKSELVGFWKTRKYKYLVRMLYNIAFKKRPIRKNLIELAGLDGDCRWTALNLTEDEFLKILELGDVDESFIIN